jgi:hypothetical protein
MKRYEGDVRIYKITIARKTRNAGGYVAAVDQGEALAELINSELLAECLDKASQVQVVMVPPAEVLQMSIEDPSDYPRIWNSITGELEPGVEISDTTDITATAATWAWLHEEDVAAIGDGFVLFVCD